MADEHLRALERAAAQGDPDARCRLLAERLRIGALQAEDLALAQALGDPAALATGGVEDPQPPLVDLLQALADRDPALLVQALLAGGRLLLPVYRTWLPTEVRCDEALQAAEAWLAARDEPSARRAWDAAVAAQGAINHTTYTMLERWNIGMISRAQMTALEYVARTAHDAADGAFRVQHADGLPQASSLLRLDEAARQGGWLQPDATRQTLRESLISRLI